jgi:sarcosine oxidase, subunit gamma
MTTDSMRRSFVRHPGRTPAIPGSLTLADLSVLPRWGVKGREAFAYLEKHRAVVPADNNRAERQADGSLVVRLSPGEALVLPSFESGRSIVAEAMEALRPEGLGACYPVPRQDTLCWLMVKGDAAPQMFAKLCGVDLAADQFADGAVAQTSVARLSAIVLRHDIGASLVFSILADSASAEYLWDCLVDAMDEFAGVTIPMQSPGANVK